VARLVTTTPVINTAARLLHVPPASLSGEVSASVDPNTGFLTIVAQDRDPVRAAAIANGFAAALADHQAQQVTSAIDQQISALRKQRDAIPRSNAGARITIDQQITQLQALASSGNSGATVVQAAVPSDSPVSPKTRRAVELALVVALLLAIGAVLAAESADRRLRAPEDIESLTGWPLLAAVPPSAFSADRLGEPQNEEAFQMLRAALTYFNVDRQLSSVAIISPAVGDGKTTVAVGLALAAAQAGKRAILVDADLRRAQVSVRLGIAADAGLGSVLAGDRQVDEVMLGPVGPPHGGTLLVLPAGPPPPNPAALLGSQSMRGLLHELESRSDLVIIDSVAALAVSDALPLLQAVSGCVVVVRLNRSSRAGVRRLQKVLASTQATVLGVVATGSSAAARGYAAYPYAHAENGHRGGALGLLHLRRPRSRV
jgi:capsular exopolysaccharide synthesis family protein